MKVRLTALRPRRGRQRAAVKPALPATTPAHVLHWVPGYVISTGRGSWELQDSAAYETGAPGWDCPWLDAARDETSESLALWTAGQLGYPVKLEPGSATIRVVTIRPLSVHHDTEPLYYVLPAGTVTEGGPR